MSMAVIKNMTESFKRRHEADIIKPMRLKSPSNEQQIVYRRKILNIKAKTGFWNSLERLVAQCCDIVLGTHIITRQEQAIGEEIKKISGNLYGNLPDYSQITKDIRKVLYVNPEQGYLIRQEGFKLVAYSGVDIVASKKAFGYTYKGRVDLITLTSEDKYDDLLYDLKSAYEGREWKQLYIKSQETKLREEANNLKNASLAFARQHPARFLAEAGINIDRLIESNTSQEQLAVLIKFNLNNNHSHDFNLTLLVNKFNSALLREIFHYHKEKGDEREFSESEPGVVALGLLDVMVSPSAARRRKHEQEANLLHNIFDNIVKKGNLEAGIRVAKNNGCHQEFFSMLISLEKNLPLFDQLEPDTRKVLYLNHEQGYMLVQEGKSILLCSKPFGLNNPLKTEIKSLSLASRNEYIQIKESLCVRKIWELAKQVQNDDGRAFIEELVPIVHDFATKHGIEFNGLFSVEKAREVGVTLTENLDIMTIHPNAQYLEHLLLFFLLHHDSIFNKLDLLGTSIDQAYREFTKLAVAHGLMDERLNLSFLHAIMPKINVLKEQKPELFYLDTSPELLEFFDENESLKTYGVQNLGSLSVFSKAVLNNAYGFNKFELEDSNDPRKYALPLEFANMHERLKDKYINQETRQADKLSLIYTLDPIRLQEAVAEPGISKAQHYIARLKAFYNLIGLTNPEIPEHPLDPNGRLNPIIGRKIKEYLAKNRDAFFKHGEKKDGSVIREFFARLTANQMSGLKGLSISTDASAMVNSTYTSQYDEGLVLLGLENAEVSPISLNIKNVLKSFFATQAREQRIESIESEIKEIGRLIEDLNQSRKNLSAISRIISDDEEGNIELVRQSEEIDDKLKALEGRKSELQILLEMAKLKGSNTEVFIGTQILAVNLQLTHVSTEIADLEKKLSKQSLVTTSSGDSDSINNIKSKLEQKRYQEKLLKIDLESLKQEQVDQLIRGKELRIL